MILIGFDCATKSLGVCIVEYNENWQKDLNSILKEFQEISTQQNKKISDAEKLNKLIILTENIANIINNIIIILYINVFDLIPENQTKKSKSLKKTTQTKSINPLKNKPSVELQQKDILILKTIRLKGVLTNLDSYIKNTIKKPLNVVLIEYQMGINHKSHEISSQLLYHYSSLNMQFKSLNTIYQSSLFTSLNTPKLEIMGPSLKNTVSFNIAGKYSNFIKKYTTTYTANKNHTKFNLNTFLGTFKQESLVSKLPKLYLDDAADAFMMIFAYLKLNKMLNLSHIILSTT
jgi:hypothetical protein